MKSMTITLVYLLSALQFIVSCGSQPEPETYLLPQDFTGKVNIIFNQANGEPVKYENGRRVYEIPANGILLTQFKDEDGIIDHEYYYVDSAGNRTRLNVFSDDEKEKATNAGVFRDGTVGVYGNSSDPKSLSYQEFYIASGNEFEMYFTPQYQKDFVDKVRLLTGYNF
ncbi:MAG: hypothetical protein ABWZ25_17610 [Chitinophagaceae bacterium]